HGTSCSNKVLRNQMVAVRLPSAATPLGGSPMEIFEAFERAVSSTAGIVKGVRREQLTAPTPCTEWTVGALLNHLVGTLWLAEGLLSDTPPRYQTPPGGLPAADLVGGDPSAAYAEAAAAA